MSNDPNLKSRPTARLLHALRFAAEKHRDHRRKGATAAPYINHPIAVAEQLAATEAGEDTDLLMAAVLHDVVEDTDTTEEEVRAEFGERVRSIVMEVTDDPSFKRKQRRAHVIETIAAKSPEARLLKLSDLIANTIDLIDHPPHWNDHQKREYLEWGEAVVAELRGIHPEMEQRYADLAEQAWRLLG